MIKTEAQIADERVARSVLLFDTHADVPTNWRDKLDGNRINFSDDYLCVLGQVFSGNHRGMSGFRYARDYVFQDVFSSQGYSMEYYGWSSGADSNGEYVSVSALTGAWKRYLASGIGRSLRNELVARRATQLATITTQEAALAKAQRDLDRSRTLLAEYDTALTVLPEPVAPTSETVTDDDSVTSSTDEDNE